MDDQPNPKFTSQKKSHDRLQASADCSYPIAVHKRGPDDHSCPITAQKRPPWPFVAEPFVPYNRAKGGAWWPFTPYHRAEEVPWPFSAPGHSYPITAQWMTLWPRIPYYRGEEGPMTACISTGTAAAATKEQNKTKQKNMRAKCSTNSCKNLQQKKLTSFLSLSLCVFLVSHLVLHAVGLFSCACFPSAK